MQRPQAKSKIMAVVIPCAVLVLVLANRVDAAGLDTKRINGDDAAALLGTGTGVIVGIVDSGVDVNHPALSGTVSGGQPRLVAEANFVTTEPTNTGDDVYGHGTAVAAQIMSRNSSHLAVATDARYVDARVLDSTNSFSSDAWVVNGMGFAVANGADIINLSLGYFNSNTSGNSRLSEMADYISYGLRIPITVSAGNAGTSSNPLPQGPGDAFNVFSVGSTSKASGWSQIVSSSSYGPTTDGRDKPDISAPGDLVATAQEHTTGYSLWSGTSFAAPNVAGVLTAAIGYGQANGLSTDPLVLKAALINTAEKVLDRSGNAWAPQAASTSAGVLTVTSPLQASAGAGQVDGLQFAKEYIAGQHGPGNVPGAGWDLDNVGTTPLDYHLGELLAGSSLSTTLDWMRHVGWSDLNHNGLIDSSDAFPVLSPLAHLNLYVYRDGQLIADSLSRVDDVQALFLTNIAAGDYDIRVTRASGSGASEEFGLAWTATQVPEPSTLALFALGGGALFARRRKKGDRTT
jgi:subtilisin family serine protease